MSDARKIADLLRAKDSPLAALAQGSQRQHALNSHFNALIDAPLADHVQVASAENGILTLAAQTSVWGHRIRYLAPTILEQLRKIDPSLHDVRIIVRPPREEAVAAPLPTRKAHLSESSAELIGGIAQTCDNPKLATVLERLSKLAETKR